VRRSSSRHADRAADERILRPVRPGDIAPDGFLESEYHRAHYASGRIGDELNYLWPLEPGVRLACKASVSAPRGAAGRAA